LRGQLQAALADYARALQLDPTCVIGSWSPGVALGARAVATRQLAELIDGRRPPPAAAPPAAELQIIVQLPEQTPADAAFPEAETFVPTAAAEPPPAPPKRAPQEFPDAETFAPAEPPAPRRPTKRVRKPAPSGSELSAQKELPASPPPAPSLPKAVCPICRVHMVPEEALAGGRVRCSICHQAVLPGPVAASSARVRPKAARKKETADEEQASWSALLRQKPYHVALAASAALVFCYLLFGGSAWSETTDLVAVQPAHGEVVCDGKPLPEAAIRLHPVGAARDFPRPQGLSDASGAFALWTYRKDDGVPRGEYRVTVSCFEKVDPKEERRPRNVLPIRYSRPETSGLTVQIREGDNKLPALKISKR
jgi:hypothetical protein